MVVVVVVVVEVVLVFDAAVAPVVLVLLIWSNSGFRAPRVKCVRLFDTPVFCSEDLGGARCRPSTTLVVVLPPSVFG